MGDREKLGASDGERVWPSRLEVPVADRRSRRGQVSPPCSHCLLSPGIYMIVFERGRDVTSRNATVLVHQVLADAGALDYCAFQLSCHDKLE